MSYPITFEHAVKKYGDNIIIPDLSLEIHDGEFFTLLGAFGMWKNNVTAYGSRV